MPLTRSLTSLGRLIATTAAVAASLVATPTIAAPTGLEKKSGVWVEGPGYDVTYGGSYDSCAARCLGADRCVMIEFYRPERKCNLYSSIRPLKPGGSSLVGIRSAAGK